jgi:hypothetical protein
VRPVSRLGSGDRPAYARDTPPASGRDDFTAEVTHSVVISTHNRDAGCVTDAPAGRPDRSEEA